MLYPQLPASLEPALEARLVDLYAGPRQDFVSERRSLSQEVGSQDADLAIWISKLPKPKLLAWAINRLRAEHPETFEALLTSGAQLRDALRTGAPNAAMAQRRAAVDRALGAIDQLWQTEGLVLTVSQRRTLSSTLEALSIGASEDPLVLAGWRGLLAGDLQPPGLESLVGMTVGSKTAVPGRSASGKAKANASKSPARKRTDSKPARSTAARKELASARSRVTRAAKALAKLAKKGEEARARVVEVQDLLAEVRAARAELRAKIDRAQGELKRAERNVSRLEGRLR